MAERDWDSITKTARRILERMGREPVSAPGEDLPAHEPELTEISAVPPAREVVVPQSTALSAEQFEDVLEHDERILTIATQEPETTLRRFQSVARHSGKAIYLWYPDQGLRSLKVNDMGVPRSMRMVDALRYIANSRHYGVYAFVYFEAQINLACTEIMREISKSRARYDRKIVLIGQEFALPRNLLGLARQLIHEPEQRLRLRDGRWVT